MNIEKAKRLFSSDWSAFTCDGIKTSNEIDALEKLAKQETDEKWNWKMDFCLRRKWNPSDSYFWSRAEDAYFEQLST